MCVVHFYYLCTTILTTAFMATVTAFIRTTKTDKNKPVKVRFRLRDGREFQLFHKSALSVLPDRWDEKQQKIKAKILINEQERKDFNKAVSDRKDLIHSIYLQNGKTLTSELLDAEIEKALHPEKYEHPKQTFFEAFDEFLEKHPLSDVRRKNYYVTYRALRRFELYTRKASYINRNFTLTLDDVTADTLQSFSDFLKKEQILSKELPEIYKQFPGYHEQKQRGQNTVNDALKKVRTFFLWCVNNEKTENNPFRKYTIEESIYGTPYYITIDERNHLYKLDLTARPALEIQRDIFVFQCLVGCRVGDLYSLTKENVINGAIEYIARKTRDGRPVTVRVPLNSIAKEILEKYADFEGKTLFPYISEQKYNEAIKEAFTAAELVRPVVILDTVTRESVIRPLNEIASSHLARRCFIGNLYKQVKDPNLVGALSGHKEGSRAFARYREIDEDMKNELVKMLE